jgi:hypothetical protein
MMRSVFFGFIGLLALQAPAMAATSPACDAVVRDWQAAGFSSPAKPAQARVLGNVGYATSGPQFQQMMQAIRHACDTDDQVVAGQQAAVAETLLHSGKDAL